MPNVAPFASLKGQTRDSKVKHRRTLISCLWAGFAGELTAVGSATSQRWDAV